jgi:hypothetical protein
MQDDELERFTAALTGAMDVYSKTVNAMTIRIWWAALKKYDLHAVLSGLSRHIENPDSGQYAPKPADIVKQVEGTTQDRALVAWAMVERAIRTVGSYQTVVFDDPYIHLAIQDMGGWIKLNQVTNDELPFVAKEFENRYRGHASRKTEDYPSKLIGIAEHSNLEAGQKVAPPLLIGVKEKAKQIYLGGVENKTLSISPLGSLELKRIA